MLHIVLTLFLNALVVFVVARLTPGVRIDGYVTAIGVAVVYSVLTYLLKSALIFMAFPLVLLSFGLFLLVINGFLLWMTDKLIDGFEIRGLGPLVIATIGITIGNTLVHQLVR